MSTWRMDLFHGSSLDEAGEVRLEQKLGTTPKAMKEVFGGMPRSRIALAGLLYLLCFEHFDNLGAYSNPVRKPAFSSYLFTRIRRRSTLPQQSRGCLFLIGAPLYREALV